MYTTKFIFKVPVIFWKLKLCRAWVERARGQIFRFFGIGLIKICLPNQQHSARLQKSNKSSISLHPNGYRYWVGSGSGSLKVVAGSGINRSDSQNWLLQSVTWVSGGGVSGGGGGVVRNLGRKLFLGLWRWWFRWRRFVSYLGRKLFLGLWRWWFRWRRFC